ncbi:MAG: STAS-like domain-containing protein [Methanothrix sp.]|jgi:hypothetical protein|nr:STAS-like domain-containing protein [Methanothrix sp.]
MKENIEEIRLTEIVGSELCIASEDGQKAHDSIKRALVKGKRVKISFKNVDDLTSAFLNSAIGQLYGEFSDDELKSKLSVADASNEDLVLLKRVINRAKEFFRDKERFEMATRKMLGEDDVAAN